jgi:hypothetical protein
VFTTYIVILSYDTDQIVPKEPYRNGPKTFVPRGG